MITKQGNHKKAKQACLGKITHLCMLLLKSHALGSVINVKIIFLFFTLCSTLLEITVFGEEIPADCELNNDPGGFQNNRASWKTCQDVVISTPPHVSWIWSHFGKWNSNELRVPDEWLRTNSVWQPPEALIYLNEPLRKTNNNMFAACKH